MSRTKAKNTYHSYFRAAERFGWSKDQARKFMKQASRYGKSWENIEPGPLKEFMKKKQQCTPRRIKYYVGYIFVFASTSTRCFTVYKPDLEEFMIAEDENI